MTHDGAQQLLAAEALEALEPGERARVLEHLRECPECAQELEQYRRVAASLADAVPVEPMEQQRSERLRARLVARARADRSGAGEARGLDPETPPAVPLPLRRSHGFGQWAGWAVAAGLASLLLTHHAFHRPVASLGWIAASVFGVLLVGVGIYAAVQRRRVQELKRERESAR